MLKFAIEYYMLSSHLKLKQTTIRLKLYSSNSNIIVLDDFIIKSKKRRNRQSFSVQVPKDGLYKLKLPVINHRLPVSFRPLKAMHYGIQGNKTGCSVLHFISGKWNRSKIREFFFEVPRKAPFFSLYFYADNREPFDITIYDADGKINGTVRNAIGCGKLKCKTDNKHGIWKIKISNIREDVYFSFSSELPGLISKIKENLPRLQ